MLEVNHLIGFGSGGGGSAHRHWRLYVNTTTSAYFANASEIEMRASSGGVDQCTGGTASASGGTAAGAFDDSTGKWTAGPLPQWIGYEFTSPVEVRQISLKCEDDVVSTPSANPTNFDLQWSDDGVDWTTVQTFLASWAGVSPETKVFDVTA